MISYRCFSPWSLCWGESLLLCENDVLAMYMYVLAQMFPCGVVGKHYREKHGTCWMSDPVVILL